MYTKYIIGEVKQLETLVVALLVLIPVFMVALGCMVDNWAAPRLQQIRFPARRPKSQRKLSPV